MYEVLKIFGISVCMSAYITWTSSYRIGNFEREVRMTLRNMKNELDNDIILLSKHISQNRVEIKKVRDNGDSNV
jgi:hypothetical protein